MFEFSVPQTKTPLFLKEAAHCMFQRPAEGTGGIGGWGAGVGRMARHSTHLGLALLLKPETTPEIITHFRVTITNVN